MTAMRVDVAPGVVHYPGYLDRPAQEALADAVAYFKQAGMCP